MIELDTTTLYLLFLGTLLFVILGTWVVTHLKDRKKLPVPPLYTLETCEYCHNTYLHPSEKQVSQCTQCDSFNSSTN